MTKTNLERQYPWARFVLSPDSIVPHRVRFRSRAASIRSASRFSEAYDGAELPGVSGSLYR